MSSTTSPQPIHTVLVGLDGSEESERAGAFAGRLAVSTGAAVVAAHATGLLDVWPDDPEHARERNSHARVNDLMGAAWTESLRSEGVEPEIVCRDGSPAHVLLSLADELNADLIVVGTRGVGAADPYGLGSVATKLTHESRKPVVVVPSPAPRRRFPANEL
jgi:nucleotide-binding universal stress UspA family protein